MIQNIDNKHVGFGGENVFNVFVRSFSSLLFYNRTQSNVSVCKS